MQFCNREYLEVVGGEEIIFMILLLHGYIHKKSFLARISNYNNKDPPVCVFAH
jgi:hypothetical protein